MQTLLYNFENEIMELRQHLQYVKDISTAIDTESPLFNYVNSVTKKKFNYKSLVISLYGIVENYSEKFLVKYLENVCVIIPEYKNLKEVIKKKNTYNSASLTLKVIEQKSHKYNHLKELDLIVNLNSCLTNGSNYLINYEAFTILTGNMKHARMCELFKQIDLDLNKAFNKYTDFNLVNSANQFLKLDELVEMRNEVAHGNVNTLLNPSELEEYIDFIERYFKNLHKVLLIDLEQEKLKYWSKFQSVKLENLQVFRGNIIGFSNDKNIIITLKSLIIIEKEDEAFQIATIENINTFPDNNNMCLKLNSVNVIKSNRKFYLKQ